MRACKGSGVAGGIFTVMMMVISAGCGGGGASDNKATAKVSGKVTHNGAGVSGGELVFSPIVDPGAKGPAGQAGRAAINADGTYTVTTYVDGDGAVIGQHRIVYAPPVVPAAAHNENGQPVAEQLNAVKLVPSKETVTVAKGSNSIDIELVAPPK